MQAHTRWNSQQHGLIRLFLPIWLLAGILACFWQSIGYADGVKFEQLIQSAKSKRLWQAHEWHVLLHYSAHAFDKGYTSLVDDEAFFLNDAGKTSPQAELEATIQALFQSSTDPNQAVHCRFPARVNWLLGALNSSPRDLQLSNCPNLDRWLKSMAGDSISLIFPVSVLNSPASLFGHTFLRINRKTENKPDLLAWSISYAAHTQQEKGATFAYKGLSGAYPGKFSLSPYYRRVKEYSDIESRDLWEYQLGFSPAEIRSLTLHLWELLPVYSDYYFLDENCTYQLLFLLDAARPQLRLLEQFTLDVIPSETVKAIIGTPGLLKNVHYRPSNEKIINARANRLSRSDRKLAKQIGDGYLSIHANALLARPEIIQAQILELAYDALAYRQAINEKNNASKNADAENEQRLFALLSARSKLNLTAQTPVLSSPQYRPDQGHHARRINVHVGYEHPWSYQQIDLRWAYHHLDDPLMGFAPGAQLEFFKPAIRYYPDKNRVQFEALDLVSIISLPTRTDFIKPFSWELSAGVQRHRLNVDQWPLMGDFKVGWGVSYALSQNSQMALLIDVNALFSDALKQFTALGSGGRMEAFWQINPTYKVGLYANVMRYFQGISQTAYQIGGKQQVNLDADNALVMDISQARELGDAFFRVQLTWQHYF